MRKAKIAIASVLKPVTDNRAFGKLAISLRETTKYHINIIGFLEKNPPQTQNIEFSVIFRRHRLHPSRLLAPLRLLRSLIRYRPNLLIVTTYELLLPAVLLKRTLGFCLIYDVQENYAKNIRLNHSLPSWLAFFAGHYVQFVEKVSRPFIDHFVFAEQCYQTEFPDWSPFTILENKYQGPSNSTPPFRLNKSQFDFLITGTITPVYGTEQAIRWFDAIRKQFPGSRLHIIGHVPLVDFRSKLKRYAREIHEINLEISDHPLPQCSVHQAMRQADVLLLPYQELPSIWPKIPSKLYEALALGIPVIIPKNPVWEALVLQYPAGTSIDFDPPSVCISPLKSLSETLLFAKPVGDEVTWESEEKKWLKLVEYYTSEATSRTPPV